MPYKDKKKQKENSRLYRQNNKESIRLSNKNGEKKIRKIYDKKKEYGKKRIGKKSI